MDKVLLVLTVCALALGSAGWLAQWVGARPTGTAAMRAVAASMRLACAPFPWRRRAIIAFVLAMGVLSLHGLTRPPPPAGMAVLSVGALGLGALLETASAWIAAWIGEKAWVRVAAGARTSDDAALQVALRAAAVRGLMASAASLSGFAVLFAIAHAARGIPAEHVPRVLAPYALGAAAAAAMGGEGRTTSSVFVTTAIESVGATMLAGLFVTANAPLLAARGIEPIAVICVPLLLRTFGVVASTIGAMSIALGEDEEPIAALHRGLQVAAPLTLLGAGATAFWSLRPWWLPMGASAATGVLCGYALILAMQYATHADYRPTRSLAESLRGEGAPPFAQGVAAGLRGAVLPMLIVTATIVVAYSCAELSGLPDAGVLGVALAASTLLGLSGFVLTLDGVARASAGARRVIAESVGPDEPHVVVRIDRLLDAGSNAHAISRSYATTAVLVVAVLIVTVLGLRAHAIVSLASVGASIVAMALVFFVAALSLREQSAGATNAVVAVAVLAPFGLGALFRSTHGRGVEGVSALVFATAALAVFLALAMEVATASWANAGATKESSPAFAAAAAVLLDLSQLVATAALVSGPFLT